MANSNLIIFYPEKIIQNISSLETLPVSVPKWVTRPISLVKDGVSVTKDNTPAELLQIDNRQKESFKIDYSVPFSLAQYSLFIDTETKPLSSKVEVEKFDKFEKKFKAINSPDINSIIKLQSWKIIDKNQLSFSALIEPSKFPNPGVYKFKFDIFTQRLQAPVWWKEWDWQARSDDQDGSKTHNLEEFLIGLKNRTETLQTGKLNKSEGNNWLIGRFCYGIQKN